MHGVELPDHEAKEFVLVARRAADPVAALNGNELADDVVRLLISAGRNMCDIGVVDDDAAFFMPIHGSRPDASAANRDRNW